MRQAMFIVVVDHEELFMAFPGKEGRERIQALSLDSLREILDAAPVVRTVTADKTSHGFTLFRPTLFINDSHRMVAVIDPKGGHDGQGKAEFWCSQTIKFRAMPPCPTETRVEKLAGIWITPSGLHALSYNSLNYGHTGVTWMRGDLLLGKSS